METKEYLVLVQIGGAGDKEVWKPGSRIMLTDERALPHLLNHNIQAINATVPPATTPSSTQTIHTADEAPAPAAAPKPTTKKKEEAN